MKQLGALLVLLDVMSVPQGAGELLYQKDRDTPQNFWKEPLGGTKTLHCGCGMKFFALLKQHIISCHIVFQLNTLKQGWTWEIIFEYIPQLKLNIHFSEHVTSIAKYCHCQSCVCPLIDNLVYCIKSNYYYCYYCCVAFKAEHPKR